MSCKSKVACQIDETSDQEEKEKGTSEVLISVGQVYRVERGVCKHEFP